MPVWKSNERVLGVIDQGQSHFFDVVKQAEWENYWGKYFENLPSPKSEWKVRKYSEDRANDEEGCHNTGVVSYTDKQTGFPVWIYSAEDGYYFGNPNLTLEIVHCGYRDIEYSNPFVPQKIQAIERVRRTWRANSNWKKTLRNNLVVEVLLPDGRDYLEQSGYEESDVPNIWIEKTRAYIFRIGNKQAVLVFHNNDEGEMAIIPRLPTDPELDFDPTDLLGNDSSPRKFDFKKGVVLPR